MRYLASAARGRLPFFRTPKPHQASTPSWRPRHQKTIPHRRLRHQPVATMSLLKLLSLMVATAAAFTPSVRPSVRTPQRPTLVPVAMSKVRHTSSRVCQLTAVSRRMPNLASSRQRCTRVASCSVTRGSKKFVCSSAAHVEQEAYFQRNLCQHAGGKGISLHSQAISEFCLFVGASVRAFDVFWSARHWPNAGQNARIADQES